MEGCGCNISTQEREETLFETRVKMAEEPLRAYGEGKGTVCHPVCGYRKDKNRDKLFHGIQGWSHPWLTQSRGFRSSYFCSAL